jgi:hypothetical protein
MVEISESAAPHSDPPAADGTDVSTAKIANKRPGLSVWRMTLAAWAVSFFSFGLLILMIIVSDWAPEFVAKLPTIPDPLGAFIVAWIYVCVASIFISPPVALVLTVIGRMVMRTAKFSDVVALVVMICCCLGLVLASLIF